MKIPAVSKEKRVLVIGDVMLDRYWWGSVSRISPEAPVPVVRLDDTSVAVGGAANVATNVRGLGATPVLVGCIGDDGEGELIQKHLGTSGVGSETMLVIPGRPSTVKTRIVAHGQHVARVDQEINENLSSSDEASLIQLVEETIASVDALVLSDYAKGLLSDRVLTSVIHAARSNGIPVIVDPKGKDYTKYRGAALVTPNKREAAEACNLYPDQSSAVESSGRKLLSLLDGTSILITEGEHGMTLFEPGLEPFHTNASAHEVYDVTGAGDTVAAALSVAIACGLSLRNAVEFANAAAGIAVEKVGTTVVTHRMILDRYPQAVETSSSL